MIEPFVHWPQEISTTPEGAYSASVTCRNCGKGQILVTNKGHLIERALPYVTCLKCGCAELQKEAR